MPRSFDVLLLLLLLALAFSLLVLQRRALSTRGFSMSGDMKEVFAGFGRCVEEVEAADADCDRFCN